MDDEAIGLIAWIIIGVMGLVTVTAAAGGIMYMTDTAVEAVIVDKDCGSNVFNGAASQVTVETKFPIPGIEYTLKEFSDQQCSILKSGENGNYVKFHVKSERTIIYEREGGQCIYDSNGVVC